MSLWPAHPRIGAVKVPRRQTFAFVLVLAVALLAGGCSSFSREWKSAAANPPAADTIEGRWEGKWLSDVNHHNGALRCVFKRVTSTNYTAHFKATYWKIFRASYRVGFSGELKDGVWQFQGAEDLGWLFGGIYHYRGRIVPTNFFCTYECKYDHGTFELSRPK